MKWVQFVLKRRVKMKRKRFFDRMMIFGLLAGLMGVVPAFAQSGAQMSKLKIHVSPKQAYVFVDGKAIQDGSQTIKLKPGTHTVGIYNYGYTPQTQEVELSAGNTKNLDFTLQPAGDKVSGPFGYIQLKGHPRTAILVNGNTPSYFVGHADEFDNGPIWHQRLLVRPGTYQLTATEKGNTIWSGAVPVKAGEQVTVHLDNGQITTKPWKEGNTMGPQPRFRAGIASATVPIAPVTAQLTAQSNEVACGQSTLLNWNSGNAVDTSISNLGSVPANGDRTVSPMQMTTYNLTAMGPGGTAEQSATVSVDTQPTATLNLNQPEVHYHKIGDKLVQQDSTTLNWSTSNGDTVTITPLGSEAASGSQTILANPKQESVGAINEDVAYTLRTSNACGGTATRTATLHIVGSIDPQPETLPPAIALASLFYPTDYPKSNRAQIGLVASEQQKLLSAASQFKVYEQYDHMATLVVVGQADVRGPEKYNQALSQRRADRVKSYLLSQGIADDKIQTRADGKDKQLEKDGVLGLQSADSQKPEKWMSQRPQTTWLAYNRRVDIILMPGGQQSTKAYPNDASDARVLWERAVPSRKAVESASQVTPGSEQAQVRNSAR
jgi:hypothetical protein